MSATTTVHAMRKWLTAMVLVAAVASCSENDSDGNANGVTEATSSTPSITEPAAATVATTDVPSTSAAPVDAPLPVFDEIHDSAGSLWRVEVLGVVAGITSPRVAPRSRNLPPCLAIILHATYLGPDPLGAAWNLRFGSEDGGSRQWACLPDGLEDIDSGDVIPGTSVITVVGMIEFEEPLPDVVELFARDSVTDTTEYFSVAVGPLPDLPATAAGPTPPSLGDPATPLIHAVADGTVTAAVVGAWLAPVEDFVCVQVASTFVVSAEVHSITVQAQDPPMLIAGGMVRQMAECGAGADGYSIDPNLITYVPGAVYGMTWSYLVPAGSEPQALLLPGAETQLIAITLLDGPPAPP